MKVYRIDIDPNIYQSIYPDVSEDDILLYSEFDCRPMKDRWKKVDWFVLNPKLKRGNFFALEHSGGLAFDSKVFESPLFNFLEMAGEIIEIEIRSEKIYLLNVLNCIDALNDKESKFHYYANGNRGRILKYSFYPNRITECQIFKIPETSKSEVLLRETLDISNDFISIYKKEKFYGLDFIEL
jgi:hypothetical protein